MTFPKLFFLAIVIAGISSLSGCSKNVIPRGNTETVRTESAVSSQRTRVVQTARKKIGSAYQYASTGPRSFDCSGLVKYVYNRQNIPIKGSASSMSKMGGSTKISEAKPGDLIFYQRDKRVFHVSIISRVSQNALWVIHSTSSKGVIEQNIMESSYWKPMIHKVISLEAFKK